jgi:hypothetical protein
VGAGFGSGIISGVISRAGLNSGMSSGFIGFSLNEPAALLNISAWVDSCSAEAALSSIAIEVSCMPRATEPRPSFIWLICSACLSEVSATS